MTLRLGPWISTAHRWDEVLTAAATPRQRVGGAHPGPFDRASDAVDLLITEVAPAFR